MAPGARPSSNQRSEESAASSAGRKPRNGPPVSDFCTVCGDKACSHHYYGVAACHGCKCFFWRSVKQQQHYVCRYDGQCEIALDHRNSCRFCRFQRCLNAGMQIDAVRVQKPNENKPLGIGIKRTMAELHWGTYESGPDRRSEEESLASKYLNEKRPREDTRALVDQLIKLEAKANEEADFSENENPIGSRVHLGELFFCPEFFDCYRTRVNYCVRLRKVTVEEMDFCKYRTLAKAFDYIQALTEREHNVFELEDKIVLLKTGFAPMTLFDICCGTVKATKDKHLLCFPTGITVSRNEEIVSNSFINQKIVTSLIDTLGHSIAELELDDQEQAMLKAIVLFNADNERGLSAKAEHFIRELRDKVHAALYHHCQGHSKDATLRFAQLLHVLPKLTLLARDLVEHIRMVQTFSADPKDGLFFHLFGDIFQATNGQDSSTGPSSHCPGQTRQPMGLNCKAESPQQMDEKIS